MKNEKMIYLPYVRFEQKEGEAEDSGWYFTQYNAETGEGKGWHGTEFMPDCFFETNCECGEPETKFFDVHINEPIKQWSWPESPDDDAFTNYDACSNTTRVSLSSAFKCSVREANLPRCGQHPTAAEQTSPKERSAAAVLFLLGTSIPTVFIVTLLFGICNGQRPLYPLPILAVCLHECAGFTCTNRTLL